MKYLDNPSTNNYSFINSNKKKKKKTSAKEKETNWKGVDEMRLNDQRKKCKRCKSALTKVTKK